MCKQGGWMCKQGCRVLAAPGRSACAWPSAGWHQHARRGSLRTDRAPGPAHARLGPMQAHRRAGARRARTLAGRRPPRPSTGNTPPARPPRPSGGQQVTQRQGRCAAQGGGGVARSQAWRRSCRFGCRPHARAHSRQAAPPLACVRGRLAGQWAAHQSQQEVAGRVVLVPIAFRRKALQLAAQQLQRGGAPRLLGRHGGGGGGRVGGRL